MRLKVSYALKALLIIGSVVFFMACERDYNTIGVDMIDSGDITTNKKTFNVEAFNKKLKSVRTDGLSSYQLGNYRHPVFGVYKTSFAAQLTLGNANPVFGTKSPGNEAVLDTEENETVTAVYLNIPFFSVVGDTTDVDETESRPYRVDSIIGNRDVTFTLKVQEFTKYLRDLDPSSNFQESQEYFSDEDPSMFATTVLYENPSYTINEEEILFFENEEDDPETDVDETTIPSERLSPRIRVELDKAFFQENIIDNEGGSMLASQNNFKEFLRGVYTSVEVPENQLAMLFNLNNAYIEIEYDYNSDDDGTLVVEEDTFRLNLTGNKVNYIQEEAYSQEIQDEMTPGLNASRLYARGGAGSYVEIDVLGGQTSVTTAFQQAKENGWLINEANLMFYVDEAALPEKSDLTLPKRMYLYDIGNERTLIDYNIDLVGNTGVDSTSYAIFSGELDEDNEIGPRYKFRITQYVNDLIRNDSTNTKLALSTTNSILNALNVSAFNSQDEEIKIPQASISNPFGTVFFGSNVPESEKAKKLQLEIYYTEPKQN
ncbi:DUF4270 domain-containing protein [Galbibacter sp. EGI 63066]|uniref:DUF4270 domain-containing protein n=1 Tax=Galbibacter sp. EGI 63066 TaxID=2993559 RepID=UPI0022490A77|nr:DUF4270 domain-containing protein [Galbibacter sp. EGI 63066]MCX2680525.1 DUF4270 domain-containing protein [Galbibacter sp. EGI 63066]